MRAFCVRITVHTLTLSAGLSVHRLRIKYFKYAPHFLNIIVTLDLFSKVPSTEGESAVLEFLTTRRLSCFVTFLCRNDEHALMVSSLLEAIFLHGYQEHGVKVGSLVVFI